MKINYTKKDALATRIFKCERKNTKREKIIKKKN